MRKRKPKQYVFTEPQSESQYVESARVAAPPRLDSCQDPCLLRNARSEKVLNTNKTREKKYRIKEKKTVSYKTKYEILARSHARLVYHTVEGGKEGSHELAQLFRSQRSSIAA